MSPLPDHLPWTVRYQPKDSTEIQAHAKEVERVRSFIQGYQKQKKKALILHGPPGSAKTSTVIALAHELGCELIEVNASDSRNKEALDETIGNALHQQSLFSLQGKLILLDEIDGLSGTLDRGATTQINALIGKSPYPIIMTANDIWDKKFANLRKKSELIEFRGLAYPSIAKVLERICKKEHIDYDKEALKSLARLAGGDLRGAINDLQALCAEKASLTKEDLASITQRSQEQSMQQALTRIFKTTDPDVAVSAFDDTTADVNEQVLWLEENIPLEYERHDDCARAFDALSRADVLRGRIRRQQYWRLLSYINTSLTCGVALAKEEKYKKFMVYKKGDRIFRKWIYNNQNAKKRSIAEKLAAHMQQSWRSVYQQMNAYRLIARQDPRFVEQLAADAKLDADEKVWLASR